MSLAATLGSRFALLVGGRVLLLVLSLLATALLTRLLGPEGFGHFRTAVAFLAVAISLADLGLASLFVREISRQDADQERLIANALGLRLALATVALSIAVLLAFTLPLDAQDRLGILGGALGFLAYSVHLLLFGLFQQKLRQAGVVAAEISGGLVLLALILVFAWAGAEPWWFATAMGLSYIFTLTMTLIAAQRLVRFGLRLEPEIWRHLIRNGAPLALVTTLSVLYLRADTVLLAILRDPVEVGLYGVPVKVYDAFLGIVLLFVGLFAPLLARTARTDDHAFQAHLENALITLAIGTIGLAVGMVAAAPEIVLVLAGPDFAASVPILRLMAGLLILRGTVLIMRETVLALGIQQRLILGHVAAFVVAFVGYFALIPTLGGVGAALALLLAESVLLAYVATLVIRATASVAVLRVPVMALAAGLATIALVLWLEMAGAGLFWRAGVALVVYLVLLLGSRTVSLANLVGLGREMLAQKGS